MKKRFLSSLVAFLLLSPALVAAQSEEEQAPKTPPPFRSSETFEYVAEKTEPLIGLIKSDTFQGVVMRPDSSMESLRLIDDHLIPTAKIKKVDEKICREAAVRMLGPEQGEDPAIRINKVEIFESSRGTACELEAMDVKTAPSPKRYRVLVGLYKGQVRALVARDRSSQLPRPGESDEFRQFFQSIK